MGVQVFHFNLEFLVQVRIKEIEPPTPAGILRLPVEGHWEGRWEADGVVTLTDGKHNIML